MEKSTKSKYSEAGVDIDKGNKFVDEIRSIVASTHQRGVLGGIGGFSSHFAIDTNKYKKPVIVNSTDGVGTKLAVAHLCGKHDTIGIDLVAMCVNDLIVGGATPVITSYSIHYTKLYDQFVSNEIAMLPVPDKVQKRSRPRP